MASAPSSPIKISSVRISPTILLLLSLLFISPSSSAGISYSDHCSFFVPESPPTDPLSADLFWIIGGRYTGGDRILGGEDHNSTLSIRRSLSFRPRSLSKTLSPETLALSGTLTFIGGGIRLSTPGRSLRLARIHPRHPRTYNRVGRASFDLSGFWSEQRGRLCMVGTGFGRSREGVSLERSAVFKLNYPNVSSITTCVVSGTVESLDDPSSVNYFEPVRVLVYDEMNYEFTKVENAVRSCAAAKAPEELLGLEYDDTYSGYRMMQSYRLGYGEKCSGGHCGPFGLAPRFMSLSRIRWLRNGKAQNGKVRMSMVFSTQRGFSFNRFFEPEKTLVGEGAWDPDRKKLCLVACRVADANGSPLVSDCTIRLSLWFPSVLTVEDMSTISGQIWSDRDENDSGYFDMVSFSTMDTLHSSHGLKYKYTKMDLVNSSCVKGDDLVVGKSRYPDFKKPEDMSFSIYVKDAVGTNSWGNAELLFVGETRVDSFYRGFSTAQSPVPGLVDVNHRHWNVSYYVRFGNDSNNSTEISAEGTYDVQRGMLCMIGCRHVNSSLDCGILINIQLAPLNPNGGEYTKGKIISKREKSDPLFFKPLEISWQGMYRSQADESIRWMDIEIAMVLISLTLSCIFIGLQLYHTKKHPEVLPSISVTMLLILMLGHMIPLVLNIMALFFKDRNMQSSLVQTGGWPEVNEVVVSAITIVALLLQSRLLQVGLSARSADEGKLGLWNAERKSLFLCLPIYIVGGLIALLVHFIPSGTQRKRLHYSSSQYRSLREDLIPYAGLILDTFLFPQILLNAFCNSKEKSLAPAFYVGTTVIRALPHVYDAYRARHYIPHLHASYIYAGRNGDFYSAAWDFIVPCVGLLFAVLIFLQQWYGGAFILPRRIKDSVGYEMVPVVST